MRSWLPSRDPDAYLGRALVPLETDEAAAVRRARELDEHVEHRRELAAAGRAPLSVRVGFFAGWLVAGSLIGLLVVGSSEHHGGGGGYDLIAGSTERHGAGGLALVAALLFGATDASRLVAVGPVGPVRWLGLAVRLLVLATLLGAAVVAFEDRDQRWYAGVLAIVVAYLAGVFTDWLVDRRRKRSAGPAAGA